MQSEIKSIRAQNLKIAIGTPCSMSWSQLTGDVCTRHCQKCEKQVFNVEKLTNIEVLELIKAGRPAPCLRLYRRRDGTVMTADCENQWAVKSANWTLRFLAMALALFVSAVTGITIFGDEIRRELGHSTGGIGSAPGPVKSPLQKSKNGHALPKAQSDSQFFAH